MSKAFTKQYNSLSNILQNNILVSGNNMQETITATWDTGATRSVITERLAKKLGLISYGKSQSFGIGGSVISNNYLIDISLPGGVQISGVQVAGSQELNNTNFDMLVGMDIIGFGDLAVSNFNDKTAFSYRIPSYGLVDFTEKNLKVKSLFNKLFNWSDD